MIAMLNVARIVGAVGFLAIAGYLAYAAVTFDSFGAAMGSAGAGIAALICLDGVGQ